jgi:serine/threonine protein kinase
MSQSDVKPHNFVLDRTAHVRLIDFGSAAPLVPGSRLVPPEYCRVPCGTCDYISPEILQAHESALVAMEMSAEEADEGEMNMGEGGYGVETDWWSTGAMIYEMAYGVAPFFARDIRSTYLKIIDFSTSLTFEMNVSVSTNLRDLLTQYVGMSWYFTWTCVIVLPAVCSLTPKFVSVAVEQRRSCNTRSLTARNGKPSTLVRKRLVYCLRFLTRESERYPSDLHLPHFIYNEDLSGAREPRLPDPHQDQPTSTPVSTPFDFSALFQPSEDYGSPALSVLRTTPRSILRQEAESFFVGFSWGPAIDAFPDVLPTTATTPTAAPPTALSLSYHRPQVPQTPTSAAFGSGQFVTPMHGGIGASPYTNTLRRTRTAPRRRPVSDREAMRQLVDCIGLSARKKVLASGRTPRGSALGPSRTKALRFATEPPEPLDFAEPWPSSSASAVRDGDSSRLDGTGVFTSDVGGDGIGGDGDESDGASASDAPPSPSPSPRPGSAMSMLSRRSATPTSSLLLRPPLPDDTPQRQHIPREAAMAPSSSLSLSSSHRPPIYLRTAGDDSEDALEVLEERHRTLMGEIASIEGRVGAMKRRTG